MATPNRSKILHNSSFCLLNSAASALCDALFQQHVPQDLAKLLQAEFPHACYLRACIPFPSTPSNMEMANLLVSGKCESKVAQAEGSAVQQVVASKTAKLFAGATINTAHDIKLLCEEMNLRAVVCAPLPETSDLYNVFNHQAPREAGPPKADSLSSKVHGCLLLGLRDEAHARKCMPRLIVMASLLGPYMCNKACEFPSVQPSSRPANPPFSAPQTAAPFTAAMLTSLVGHQQQQTSPSPFSAPWLDQVSPWTLYALQQQAAAGQLSSTSVNAVLGSQLTSSVAPLHMLNGFSLPGASSFNPPSSASLTAGSAPAPLSVGNGSLMSGGSLPQAYMNSFLQAGPTLASSHTPDALVAASLLQQQNMAIAQSQGAQGGHPMLLGGVPGWADNGSAAGTGLLGQFGAPGQSQVEGMYPYATGLLGRGRTSIDSSISESFADRAWLGSRSRASIELHRGSFDAPRSSIDMIDMARASQELQRVGNMDWQASDIENRLEDLLRRQQ